MEVKKKTKKVLAIAGTVIGASIVGVGLFLGKAKSKDGIKWLKSLNLEQLNEVREKVRVAYCKSGNDFSMAVKLGNLLSIIDRIIYNKTKTPNSGESLPKREHGWYL